MFPYPFHTLKSVSLSLPLPPLVVAAAAPPIAAEGLSFLLRLSPRLSLRRSSLHPGLWSLLAASSLASPGLAAACICYGGIDEIYCRSEKICFGFSDAKPRRPAQPDRHANRRHKRTVMGQTFPLSVWFGLGRLLPNPTGPARRPALAIPICAVQNSIFIPLTATPLSKVSIARPQFNNFIITPKILTLSLSSVASSSSPSVNRAGWFLGLADNNKKMKLPEIVKAGDPVLHELTQEVDPNEIRSERVQKVIDDMIRVMRKAPGVGLAAPQIGIPLRIIVLEDTKEYISYASKEEIKAQDRLPFDLLVILNPKLEKKSERTALFFEGCLSVDGFRAVVERYLDVEVTGLDRNGEPIKITASGWQARILQHECDHLDGTLYVDKMVPRTFRNVENLDLPLAQGCPKLGPR